jgi:predicted dinucleotide-binding enzyme
MNIGILGTGSVGLTLADKLISIGHSVFIGSRSKTHPKAIEFIEKHPLNCQTGTFEECAKFGAILFNCTAGMVSIEALNLASAENLANKVLVDVSNPLDFSNGMPPSLSVGNTTSMAETIQSNFPETHVVKALNTMWSGLMVNPKMLENGDHDTFICGNDDESKGMVQRILVEFGWEANHIHDLGDITKARGLEMYLPLWLSLYGSKKTGIFNIKIQGL